MTSDFFQLLRSRISEPLNLLDIGGHGGVIESWKAFGDKAKIYCFEARDEEADALIEGNAEKNVEYVPIALSHDNNGIVINVAAAEGCSSAYPPIEQLYRHYPGCTIMRPMRKVSCSSTTVDAFCEERGIETVHGMKLDTQGFELNILRGAEKALANCQFLLIEVEFNPMYEGQPLFADVDKFLRERGFVLWRLGNLAHYATAPMPGPQHAMSIGSEPGGHQSVSVPHGQLFWSDAFYVRREATPVVDQDMSRDGAIAGAALVSQWDFTDLALEMIRKSGDTSLRQEARAMLGVPFVGKARNFYDSSDLHSLCLVKGEDRSWTTDFTFTDQCIVYGPYVRLPWGEYVATFHVTTAGDTGAPLSSPIAFDVAGDLIKFDVRDLVGKEGREELDSGEVKLRFYNDLPGALFEFRVFTHGKPFDGTLTVKSVTLENLSRPDALIVAGRSQEPVFS